jgi:hypothetical protein
MPNGRGGGHRNSQYRVLTRLGNRFRARTVAVPVRPGFDVRVVPSSSGAVPSRGPEKVHERGSADPFQGPLSSQKGDGQREEGHSQW